MQIPILILISGTLTFTSGESVKVVAEVGQSTTLSCPLPTKWTKCTFVKESQHSREHEVRLTISYLGSRLIEKTSLKHDSKG